MNQFSQEVRDCIEQCLRCHAVCLATAMTECLEMGGNHLRPQHFRLMIDCVAVCQTAADLMAHKSQFHRQMCALCAQVCEACARSCDALSGMEECATACRSCAAACHAMI